MKSFKEILNCVDEWRISLYDYCLYLISSDIILNGLKNIGDDLTHEYDSLFVNLIKECEYK